MKSLLIAKSNDVEILTCNWLRKYYGMGLLPFRKLGDEAVFFYL